MIAGERHEQVTATFLMCLGLGRRRRRRGANIGPSYLKLYRPMTLTS